MRKIRTLVVDDTLSYLELSTSFLGRLEDLEVVSLQHSEEALQLLENEPFDVLLTDIQMPKVDGIQLMNHARRHNKDLVVIVMSAYPSFESAVTALTGGAVDYIVKPINKDELVSKFQRLIKEIHTKRELEVVESHFVGSWADTLIGDCAAIQALRDKLAKIAANDVDVVITGETGTGKEIVSRMIHEQSRRRQHRYVPFDCAAVPDALMESELLGYASHGPDHREQNRLGLLDFAHGGTLCLDEVAELPGHLQAKLLRVLQERAVRPLGAPSEHPVDIRVVATTSHDLERMVGQGTFSKDLFYRLGVANIELPPLRSRQGDIEKLAKHFLVQNVGKMNKSIVSFSDDALEVMAKYPWPGNVRQLQNCIKYAISMSEDRQIDVAHLPDRIVLETADLPRKESAFGYFKMRDEHMAKFERDYMIELMKTHRGSVTEAIKVAKLPRGTLYRILKKFDIDPKDFR